MEGRAWRVPIALHLIHTPLAVVAAGFVEFDSVETAIRAKESMEENSPITGTPWLIHFSNNTKGGGSKRPREDAGPAFGRLTAPRMCAQILPHASTHACTHVGTVQHDYARVWLTCIFRAHAACTVAHGLHVRLLQAKLKQETSRRDKALERARGCGRVERHEALQGGGGVGRERLGRCRVRA
eukprot:1621935-Pleurochrysis_carterae.AAC.4